MKMSLPFPQKMNLSYPCLYLPKSLYLSNNSRDYYGPM